MTFDVILNNGLVFSGDDRPAVVGNVGIRDGRVERITADPLDETGCPDVRDATGLWVIPGMVDVHTHYDIEVLAGPGLPESVRHGVTTVFLGSCSLSTVHVGPEDAGDIFGRVEAIPREHVISHLEQAPTWTSAAEYVTALEQLPLGPHLAAFIGHSDVRAATMGLDRATRREVRPSKAEIATMARLVHEALDAGFLGMSSQELLFDKLDGEVCRSRTLPSTYATARERFHLRTALRRRGRVLQSGPDINNPLSIASYLLGSLGGVRAPLKVSLLSAADLKANPFLLSPLLRLSRVMNALGGRFRWQHLPVPFEVYADGIDLVIFEEFGSGAAALHLKDAAARDELMRDAAYRERFRKDYAKKYSLRVWHRDLHDAEIVACPDGTAVGKSFGQLGDERGLHPVDAFLDLVLEHGTALRWRTTISNHRPEMLKRVAADDSMQFGFSDAGAHLRNMAFYNFGLRLLRHVRDSERAGSPFMTVHRAVHRLTGELADWYGIDAGHLREGDRADVVLLDPTRLDDSLDSYHEAEVEEYGGLSRMVNRNDDTVRAVYISGRQVVDGGRPTALLGAERVGSFLPVGRPVAPARPAATVPR